MNKKDVREVIKQVQGPNARITVNGPWLTTSCPFAPFKHPRGTDRTPSFGIIAKDNDRSVFHCFTCKSKGTIAMLWDQLGTLRGEDYSDRVRDAETSEILGPSLPRWGDKRAQRLYSELGESISDEITLIYERITESRNAQSYLRERGIGPRTAELLQLLYDPDDGSGTERIIFPVRDLNGGLYGFSGRALDPEVEPRIRDYYGLPKRSLLLGAHFAGRLCAVSTREPVVLVEGLVDYAKVRQAGFKALAAMHSGITEAQAEILKAIGRPVILMFDDDAPGQEGQDKVFGDYRKYLVFYKVRYTYFAEPDDEGYTGLDPGKLNSKQIRHMINDRRLK